MTQYKSSKWKARLKLLGRVLALFSAAAGALHSFRVRSPAGAAWSFPKMVTGALAAFVGGFGALGAVLGMLFKSPLAFIAGLLGAVASARYVCRTSAPHEGFARAFGPDWSTRISAGQQRRLLQRRWTWRLPAPPEPRWQRDVAFWTIPGTDRQLLCDIWQPPAGVSPSGLAFIYFHGSGWHFLDKDVGTRWFFRHLAAQGHVVMDVAYRLCPEVDIFGMIGDVKRAIVWMKRNAQRYGVDPERVVAAGGSAGGHLALLAAYTPGHPQLTPDDVKDGDASVRAVVSYYGPVDMRAYHQHAGAVLADPKPKERLKPKRKGFLDRVNDRITVMAVGDFADQDWNIGHYGMMAHLLGGQPDEVPEVYSLASPITHVGPHCPPTLLFQGEHDMLVPVEATRLLHCALLDLGVPVVYVEFAQTEHAFDIVLPLYSPPTQAALYDLDRFLALV